MTNEQKYRRSVERRRTKVTMEEGKFMNKYIDSEKILACLDIDGADGCDVISGMLEMANDEGELFYY